MSRELRASTGYIRTSRKIEKRVVRINLRSERSGRVDINFVFDYGAIGGTLDLPAALVELANDE